MRVLVGDIRRLLREELLNGVPEWQLREDAAEFADRIRDRITQYVLANKSQTGVERAEAINAMNDVCDKLEAKVYDLLEDQLFTFIRRV